MSVKPIVVIPHGIMGPEEFDQSKLRLEAAGYVALRVRSVLVTDKVYVVTAGAEDDESRLAAAARVYVRAHLRMVRVGRESGSILDVQTAHKILVDLVGAE